MESQWEAWEEKFMDLALSTAREGIKKGEVAVACVFIDSRTKKVLATAHNETVKTRNATRHCELVAIDKILAEYSGDVNVLHHSELFVTVEPCIMCAAALRFVRIKRVVYGCANPRFGGNGSVVSLHTKSKQSFQFNGYISQGGLREKEAIDLLKSFYSQGNPNAPKPKRQVKCFPLQETTSSSSVKPEVEVKEIIDEKKVTSISK
mmetsp:Transcript_20537/g.30737  ORF Transcript_20537/g.30737 Transcript_20537/m.30737 type:complete len:206 (+) Transcript_20537:72-689(+)